MSKNILALDASTKRTGYAISKDDELITYGVISASSQKLEKRLIVMREGVKKLIEDYKIDTIVIEEVLPESSNLDIAFAHMNNHTNKVLTWLQGVIAVCAYEANPAINFLPIGASTWRSILKLQGHAVKREFQKAKDIAYVNEHFDNIHLNPDQDDEADALCILQAYINNGYSVDNKKIKKTKQEYAF